MYEALTVIMLQGGHDFVTDRQANGQTDARGKQYVSRPFQGGGHNNSGYPDEEAHNVSSPFAKVLVY